MIGGVGTGGKGHQKGVTDTDRLGIEIVAQSAWRALLQNNDAAFIVVMPVAFRLLILVAEEERSAAAWTYSHHPQRSAIAEAKRRLKYLEVAAKDLGEILAQVVDHQLILARNCLTRGS